MHKFPGVIPFVVEETERTIAIRYPLRKGFNFVIIPKKDIKDIGDISEANAAYLIDVYLVARHLIEKHKLSKYGFATSGPGYQTVNYLRFHLTSQCI